MPRTSPPSSLARRSTPPRVAPSLVRAAAEEYGAIERPPWELLEEDEVIHGTVQMRAVTALCSRIARVYRERGLVALVGTDQRFAFRRKNPRVAVAPDVYVLEGIAPGADFVSWQTWEPGRPPPRIAFEVASPTTWRKDYVEGPGQYQELGTEEVFFFDPMAIEDASPAPEPRVLQRYQRQRDGSLRRTHAGAGPAYSRVLRLWVRVEGFELGLSRDRDGRERILSADEANAEAEGTRLLLDQAEQAREQAEQAREQAEQAREQAEQACEQAERRIQSLERELAAARAPGKPPGG